MPVEGIEGHIASLVGQGPEPDPDVDNDDHIIDTSGNISDQDGGEPEGEGDGSVEGKIEQPSGVSDELAKIREESAGRLTEITEMREKYRVQGESIEHMRQMMLADEQRRADAAEAAKYGPAVLDDPAMKRIDENFARIEGKIENDREAREHRIQEINRVNEENRLEQQYRTGLENFARTSEDKFRESHPDVAYDKAYDYLREQRGKFYTSRGLAKEEVEKRLSAEEIQLITEAGQAGRDPATDVWNMALEFGFDPATAGEAAVAVERDVSKIKEGVNFSNTSHVPSTPGGSPGEMTRKAFFEELPYPDRMRILSDPEKFEELSKTGKITM